MEITVVITTYNRCGVVKKSIDSVLLELPESRIIVVDDASTDNTLQTLETEYCEYINSGVISLVALEKNIGVTGAKNHGFSESENNWVLFLDSDDIIMSGAGEKIRFEANQYKSYSVLFFRCLDAARNPVGKLIESPLFVNLDSYLINASYGESLTLINKAVLGQTAPYIESLRGYEGLGICKILERHGPAVISPVFARVYLTEGVDRLSSFRGFLSRATFLSKGHLILVKTYGKNMGVYRSILYLTKSVLYFMVGHIYKRFVRL